MDTRHPEERERSAVYERDPRPEPTVLEITLPGPIEGTRLYLASINGKITAGLFVGARVGSIAFAMGWEGHVSIRAGRAALWIGDACIDFASIEDGRRAALELDLKVIEAGVVAEAA